MSVKFQNRSAFVLLIIMLLTWYVPSYAADQELFDVYHLEIEGNIFGFQTGDFNDDGRDDIFLVYSPADDYSARYIALFIQKMPSGFSNRADYLIALPLTAAQIDAGDVNDDGRIDIVFIDFDGVGYFSFNPGSGLVGPRRLIRQNSVYSFPHFMGIIATPFLFDITGDTAPEIVLPSPRGYIIYERGDDGDYQILNQLSAPINCLSPDKQFRDFFHRPKTELNISMASIIAVDGNLDGRQDLYFLWDRKLCCFFQDSTGNFPQSPDVSRLFFPAYLKGYFCNRLFDFNNDNRPDIAASYTSGGITGAETKVRFFVADAEGRIESNFQKELRLSDSHCNLMLGDYDHNGVPELVIPAVELGSMAATKMLLMKKADLNLLIYSFKSGMPINKPAKRRAYEFRFNFDDPQPTMEVAVNWSADYNGDRYNDAVFCGGRGEIKFFWGRNKEYLSKKADLEISLDHPSEIHPLHLNDGRYSDLIIEHNHSGRTDQLTVLINRNNK